MKKIKIGILVVFGFFFFICLYNLYSIYREEDNEKRIKQKLIDLVDISSISEEDKLDFDKLKKINPDVVGWIKVDDTNINYPILKAKDNDYYLNHSFYRKSNQLGSIFMDAKANSDFSSFNTFIYGHYTTNGVMFGQLNKYVNQSFVDNHPYFYIYTPNKNFKVEVFSSYIDNATSLSYQTSFADIDSRNEYIKLIMNKSIVKSNVTNISSDEKIVSLYSCEGIDDINKDNRYYIHGVLKEL